jgi:hypothetical protein
MKKILVSAISFVNTEKPKSEIYTIFAKRLIDDVLTKTHYDIMVSTNKTELFDDVPKSDRVKINQIDLGNHRTHVGAFNQLLKFYAIKNVDPKYDWVLYLDCDAGFTEQINAEEIENYLNSCELENYDMCALRTDATYSLSEKEFLETINLNSYPRPLFNPKFMFYGTNELWKGAVLPSEHIFLIKNNEKLPQMAKHFENFCTKFETQEPNNIITFDMEAFEIGVSAHLAGFKVKELGWGNQTNLLKIGFNHNNWEKIKV